VGIDFFELLNQFGPPHAWHHEVGNGQIKPIRSVSGQRRWAIVNYIDRVSFLAQ
jgi:hypothetical protein